MPLSRDDILKRDDMPTCEVPVPEWGEGETVRVRGLSAAQRFEFGQASQDVMNGKEGPNPTALLVALAAIDIDGARLFHIQDTDRIADLRGDVVDRIAKAVMDLSGMGDPDEKLAEAVGNSEATQSGFSPTGSPETSDAPSPNSVND